MLTQTKQAENKSKKIAKLVAGGLFGLTLLYIFTIYNLDFHSDSAAANILAREQLKTGSLFPKTWNTSTGIFLFFYNILIIPLSLFSDNQILLRDIAVAIVLIAFVALFRYLSKNAVGSDFYLITLCFLFSGTSPSVIKMSFAEAAYLISLMDNVILLILFLKAFSEDLEIKSRKWTAIFLIYIAYLSLAGILNVAYQMIPIVGAVTLNFFVENSTIESTNTIKANSLRFAKMLGLLIVSSVIGYIGYIQIVRYTGFHSGANIIYGDNSQLANRFVKFMMDAIGYQQGVRLFSMAGIMNAIIIFAVVGMIVCCVLLCKKYNEQPYSMRIVIGFALTIFAVYLYFDFVEYCKLDGAERYLYKPLVFLYMLSSYYMEKYLLNRNIVRRVLAIAAVVFFSVPHALYNLPQVASYSQAREAQLGLVNYLEDNGLKHGYATFWHAGNNMVLSDFNVEIGGVNLAERITPMYWLSSTDSYDPSKYQGESFLLLTSAEDESVNASEARSVLGDPTRVLSYGDYRIYVYPYNISANGFCGSMLDTEWINCMVTSSNEMKEENGDILIGPGDIVYGPYVMLQEGRYRFDFVFSGQNTEIPIRLTCDDGQNLLMAKNIRSGESITYSTETTINDFEIVITSNQPICVTSIRATKLS